MNSKVKALLVSLCAVLMLAVAVFGTLAYLTHEDSVRNTFTAGQVYITLDEAVVDENGDPVGNERTEEGNAYHLIPGHEYTKDPTVTVLKDSEESYVRMLVKVENITQLMDALPIGTYPQYYGADNVFLLQNLVDGWDSTVWVYAGYTPEGNIGVYEFRYYQKVDKNELDDTKLPALFTSIKFPGKDFNNENIGLLNGVNVDVIAHAIQADGFDTADEAWNEW